MKLAKSRETLAPGGFGRLQRRQDQLGVKQQIALDVHDRSIGEQILADVFRPGFSGGPQKGKHGALGVGGDDRKHTSRRNLRPEKARIDVAGAQRVFEKVPHFAVAAFPYEPGLAAEPADPNHRVARRAAGYDRRPSGDARQGLFDMIFFDIDHSTLDGPGFSQKRIILVRQDIHERRANSHDRFALVHIFAVSKTTPRFNDAEFGRSSS